MRRSLAAIVTMLFVAASESGRGDDPRPPADAPFEVGGQPEPRLSRRAQRRANRRRPPAIAPAATPPIGVTSTLGSPFESLGAEAHEPFIVHRDQSYADAGDDRQRFDLYLPKGCGGGLPLVVWVEGKTWQSIARPACPVIWLVDSGYAVASIRYRPSSTDPFPAQLDDCLAAIDCIQRDADLWGIDRDRICVAGRAAGGHLAALSGLWDESSPERPLPPVAAVCVIDAPTHLTSLGPEHDRPASPASQLVGGPLPEFREAAQQASPLTHVSSDDPPVLVIHARAGAAVPFEQSRKFTTALRAAGVPCTLVPVDAGGAEASIDRDSTGGAAFAAFLAETIGRGARPSPEAATR
jgi:acetyl esterase/lipase